MSLNVIPHKNPNVLTKTIDGETVLVKTADRGSYLLNCTATDIWRLVNGKTPLSRIIAILSKRYGQKKASVKHDVIQLIAALRKKTLIGAAPIGTVPIAAITTSGTVPKK
jgi:hypothetical protein